MRLAADNELIMPLEEFLPEPFDENWYEFAQLLGMNNAQIYGLPVAADALIMTYRPSLIGDPPDTWQQALSINGLLSFPAADPQALFTVTQYFSEAHGLYDENQNLTINQAALESIFKFYQDGQSSGLFPYWLIQYQDDATSWTTFQERQAEMSITWGTRYLQTENPTFSAAPLPTRSGSAFTLAKSWLLAFPAANLEKADVSAELAQFLTEAEFMAAWTQAAGYFPPRVDALANWEQGPQQSLASQVLPQAWPLPPQSEIDLLGTPLSTAVISVLKQEIDPANAAEQIVETLTTP
jgi:maltose-binding protein MalE